MRLGIEEIDALSGEFAQLWRHANKEIGNSLSTIAEAEHNSLWLPDEKFALFLIMGLRGQARQHLAIAKTTLLKTCRIDNGELKITRMPRRSHKDARQRKPNAVEMQSFSEMNAVMGYGLAYNEKSRLEATVKIGEAHRIPYHQIHKICALDFIQQVRDLPLMFFNTYGLFGMSERALATAIGTQVAETKLHSRHKQALRSDTRDRGEAFGSQEALGRRYLAALAELPMVEEGQLRVGEYWVNINGSRLIRTDEESLHAWDDFKNREMNSLHHEWVRRHESDGSASLENILDNAAPEAEDQIQQFIEREGWTERLTLLMDRGKLKGNQREVVETLIKHPDLIDHGRLSELAAILNRPVEQIRVEKHNAFKKIRAAAS